MLLARGLEVNLLVVDNSDSYSTDRSHKSGLHFRDLQEDFLRYIVDK